MRPQNYLRQLAYRSKVSSMCSGAEGSPAVVDADRPGDTSTIPSRQPRPRRLKYIFFVVILGIWIAAPLLSFSHPLLSDRLVLLYVACMPVLFFLFLGALVRRRWQEVLILSAMGAVVLLPYYPFEWSLRGLSLLAFRLHSSPVEDYLSRCNLVQFTESGKEQSVGECETLTGSSDEHYRTIFYDTTGEFVLPLSQRTPEWTEAMKHFEPTETLTKSEGRAEHLYGNFYIMSLSIYEKD